MARSRARFGPATITDPNTDAREAMKLVKDTSSRANREKLGLVLGRARADALLQEIDRAGAALTLRGAVARNSDTAIRQSIQGAVRDEAAPGIVREAAGEMGNPLEGGRAVTRFLAATDPRSMDRKQRAMFAEIADALTRVRGPEARDALAAVRRSMSGQEMTEQDIAKVGELVGSTIGQTLYQTGTQAIQAR